MHAFDDLSPEKVQFEKTLRKEINRDGLLLDSSLRACGADGVLKVLAVKAIRKALFNEHHEIRFPAEDQTFYAQFTWSDHETCKSLQGINKSFLSFCHYAENKAKTFSNGERASTYLKSLKYGLGAIEEIKEYNREELHRKNQFDPFINLKNDPDWNLEC